MRAAGWVMVGLVVLTGCSGDGDGSDAAPATTQDAGVIPGFVRELAADVADPVEVELPEPSADFAKWLDDEGQPARAMHDATLALLREPPGTCDDATASYDDVAEPSTVAEVAADAPTSEAREMIVSELFAAGRVIDQCDEGDAGIADELLGELAYQWAILARHIEQSEGTR